MKIHLRQYEPTFEKLYFREYVKSTVCAEYDDLQDNGCDGDGGDDDGDDDGAGYVYCDDDGVDEGDDADDVDDDGEVEDVCHDIAWR